MDRPTFRLTFTDKPELKPWINRKEAIQRLKAYEDTRLEPDVCANYKKFEDEAISKGVPFSRIVELMEADRSGRLVVLPCKAGTPVWRIENVIKPNGRGKWVTVKRVKSDEFCYGMLDWIDTPIYLTREEAEAALAEGGKS